jgi:protein TonB
MGIEGTVKVRYTVTADGRATRCTILETSGFAELDQTTCRLIERRFRYRPALDAGGSPVPQDELKTYDWWLPERRRERRG